MAGFFKCQPLDLRNSIEEWLNHEILGHIIPPIQYKSGDIGLVQTVNDGPADEGPCVPIVQGQARLALDPIARDAHVDGDGQISALSGLSVAEDRIQNPAGDFFRRWVDSTPVPSMMNF